MDELEALRRENAALHRQLAEQREQIAQLIAELARLNERVSELLAVAQRKQRKVGAPAAAAPPPAAPVVEGDARRAFEQRPKAPEKPAEARGRKEEISPHRA